VISVRIAVLDPLPVYRRGIMATLGEAGLIAEAPDDLFAWSQQHTRPVVFLTLQSSADWQLLTELGQLLTDPVIVAVLDDVSVPAYLRALSGGAAVALPRDASPERLRQVFEQAVRGMSLLPVDVVQALAGSGGRSEETSDGPTSRELVWLRELAKGTTVARLAERSGYSERAMFRLLHGLYRRMGVGNRTEALIRAHDQGWL
jgi:DNA-binding NarL/FixJ family response regulator